MRNQPIFVIIFIIIIGSIVLLSSMFVSSLTQNIVEVKMSEYTVRPVIPKVVTVGVENLASYTVFYRIRIVDAVSGDLSDERIDYSYSFDNVVVSGVTSHQVIVYPHEESKRYYIQIIDQYGEVIDYTQFQVLSRE